MTYESSSSSTAMGAFGAIYLIFCLAISVVAIIAQWKIFTKAGKPGWASIVPIYNMVVLFQIAGMNPWLLLLCIIPFAGFIVMIMALIKLAKAFGQSTGFALGLIFLSPIFFAILGFGSSTYLGPQE